MILLLPLHRPKQVYDFHKKMIPKMKQHIYNAVYPDNSPLFKKTLLCFINLRIYLHLTSHISTLYLSNRHRHCLSPLWPQL